MHGYYFRNNTNGKKNECPLGQNLRSLSVLFANICQKKSKIEIARKKERTIGHTVYIGLYVRTISLE